MTLAPGEDRIIEVIAPIAEEEAVIGAFSMAGLDSVAIEARDDHTVVVRAYWPAEAGPPPDIDVSRVAGARRMAPRSESRQDWASGWPTLTVGPFVIATDRDALSLPAPSGAHRAIVLAPGQGFGFGDHPSTRLALLALAARPVPVGPRVLDVGCGTGVLSLAAARLGARALTAYDIDPGARAATRANAGSDGTVLEVLEDAPPADSTWDLVLANITAPVLTQLAPRLVRWVAPGGHLIVSGLLDDDVEALTPRLGPMNVVDEHRDARWRALTLSA